MPSTFWFAAGGTGILVDADGKPYFCAACPCDCTCGDCCDEYTLTISGVTGACCAALNDDLTLTRDGANCRWETSWFDANSSYYVTVTCDNTDWLFKFGISSGTCNGETWTGHIAMGASECPDDGEYTLTHTAGGTCGGTVGITLTCVEEYACPDTTYCEDTCAETYTAAVSGSTGTCAACTAVNATKTITHQGTSCSWYVDWYDANGSYSIEVECVDGYWTATVRIDSPSGTGCSFGNDVWVGTIAATATSCPPGTYSLTHTEGPNCTGTMTLVVS